MIPAAYFPKFPTNVTPPPFGETCAECQRFSGDVAINNAICAFGRQMGVSVGSRIAGQCQNLCDSNGFTLASDCQVGVAYPYCKKGQARCDGTCKSTCETETIFQTVPDVCMYNPDNNSYACVAPPPGNRSAEETLGLQLREIQNPSTASFGVEDFILTLILLTLFFLLVFYILGVWSDAYKTQK
jgi:hypothetical protein